MKKKRVRTVWDDQEEKWYFSIVDVCCALTESKDSQAFWRKIKHRLKAEGNETVTNCHGLKMRAADGKMRLTDVADTEQFFRLIQPIPSPKATGCEYNSRIKRDGSVKVGNKLYR